MDGWIDHVSGAVGAVAGLRDEGAHAKGLVREIAVDAVAARHGRAVVGVSSLAAPAVEAELERGPARV